MKDEDVLKLLPPNTRKILDYLGYVNDQSNPLHATIGAIYEQAARYACYNRVSIDGMKGLEPVSLYFINFAKSGAYKDEIIRTIADVNEKPLAKQRIMKDASIDRKEKEYRLGLSGLKKKEDKDDYKENKPVKWRNTYSGGTVQGMYIDRKGMADAGFGSLHFEHSEVMDLLGKKDGKAKEIMSVMKDVFPKGNSKTESVAYQRRSNVDGVPMTMFLHGVSSGLKESRELMDMVLYILESGMAKRSYVFFDDKHNRKKLSLEEMDNNALEAAMLRPFVEDIFMNTYKAVKLTGINGNYSQDKVITLGEGVKEKMNEYRNVCIEMAEKAKSRVLEAEIIDRFWKALRLAAAIALIEHPKSLVITLQDYKTAGILTEYWGNQFKDFLKDKTDPLHVKLYDYISKNKGCLTGEIREAVGFGNNPNSTRDMNHALEIVAEMAEENGYILHNEQHGRRCKYSIIRDPKDSRTGAQIDFDLVDFN